MGSAHLSLQFRPINPSTPASPSPAIAHRRPSHQKTLRRRPPLPEIPSSGTKVRDPVYLAASFPSLYSLRSRRPPRLPRGRLPLLVFLAAAAPSSSSSRPAPSPSSSLRTRLLCELDLVGAVAPPAGGGPKENPVRRAAWRVVVLCLQ